MQAAGLRHVLLVTVLLAGAGLYAVIDRAPGMGTPRWPADNLAYSVDAWTTGPQAVELIDTAESVTRTFRNSAGTSATFTLLTNQAPKLYAAGAEVPFLGSGYTVGPAPSAVESASDGVQSLVARRGTEQWLVMYAYGERRGLLGNGPTAWMLAFTDGLGGRANDYYKLFMTARDDSHDVRLARDIAQLARTVFPRVAGWYAV
jgi:hypothetical protein